MTQEAAELITNYAGEIRENYSGRGMFGKTTVGVVFDEEREFLKAIADILEHEELPERKEVAKSIRRLSTDNMGRGIIYY